MQMATAREQAIAAIRSGDADALRALVEADSSVAGERDDNGVSLLLLACYFRRPDLAELLLAAEPPLDIFESSALPGLTGMGRALLNADRGLASRYSADGFTALHLASYFDRPEMARLLLDHGADPNAVSRNAMSLRPLHSAASSRAAGVAQMLLDAGATVNDKQHGGYTPLHAAANNGDMPLINLLLEHGADPYVASDDGRTPIDIAKERGHLEAAERLAAPRIAAVT
jgi:ankyrin repeat protein